MRQITQNYRTGELKLRDVEWPALRPGGVLVRTRFSVVSLGTEGMKVREAKLSLLGKARARPDQVKKVISVLRQQGPIATFQKVMNKLDSLTPLGYSLSGEVVGVGAGCEEFRIGQRVACGGAGYANHAEINFVPKISWWRCLSACRCTMRHSRRLARLHCMVSVKRVCNWGRRPASSAWD